MSVLICDKPLVMNEWEGKPILESQNHTSQFSLKEIIIVRKSLEDDECSGEDIITSEMVKVVEKNGIIALQ